MTTPFPLPEETVIVFDRDEELSAYSSFTHVMNYLEAIDVVYGEYPAAYLLDGRVLELTAPEGCKGPVLLTRTERSDLADLERRTARHWARYAAGDAPLGPEETARLLLAPGERSGGGVPGRLLRWLSRWG
ncbi:hypothetical protein [Streptomyces sp. 4F14]|uniref:hypothetical protein n=1 Tax=Streptomyces sp. 4F14 TaxID=3394380 RepID=UPI003A83C13C